MLTYLEADLQKETNEIIKDLINLQEKAQLKKRKLKKNYLISLHLEY
jgi:hypothetical protein